MMYRACCCGNCQHYIIMKSNYGECGKGHESPTQTSGFVEPNDICDKDFEWRDDIKGKPSREIMLGFGQKR